MKSAENKNFGSWKVLERARELGCLSYVDVAFAELLLGESSELEAAFLCHLSRSVREGNLCVFKSENEMIPSPHDLWLADLSAEDAEEIRPLLDRLASSPVSLPERLVTQVGEQVEAIPMTPIVRSGNLFYFQKYWLFETSFYNALNRLIAQDPAHRLDVEEKVIKMRDAGILNNEQAKAIAKSCNSSFTMICGGPGTGKTYTAGQLIKVLLSSLSEEEKENFKIVLAAPTGKAANNLEKSLRKDEPGAKITAQTLHSLLQIKISNKMEHRPEKRINGDLVIVDESSMIDVRLMSYLFDSIRPGARLILLGDPFQLPPVEVGSVFKDAVGAFKDHVAELKRCIRAELEEIVEFSSLVKSGDVEGIKEHFLKGNEAVIKVDIPHEVHPRKVQEALLAYAKEHLPDPFISEDSDAAGWFDAFNRFRILTPMREGLFGVKEVNRLFHQQRIAAVPRDSMYVSPIMVVANDYKMELFNGETGLLIRRKTDPTHLSEGDFAIFPGGRKIPALLLPKYEYAYCLSVHKSQGSEFEHVLLLLPEGSERFGREVLYTAVTRTKRRLVIWGSDSTLENTASRPSRRLSGIGMHLGKN